MVFTASIAVIICTITAVLAFLGRTSDDEHVKGFLSIVAVYFLVVLAAMARSFSETELGDVAVTWMLAAAFVALLLVSLFLTVMMIFKYVLMLFDYLKRKRKGVFSLKKDV